MASGEECDVSLQESGVRRTRSARAVATRRRSGRKKTATAPRATRSKRSTRVSHTVDSDGESDEVQVELSQVVSDAEASQDNADEQGSPEAPRDEYEEDEQVPASLDTSTEENSAVENGVGDRDHNDYVEQDAVNEGSDVEDTFTAQIADTVEETENGSNIGIAVEEQQETTADDDNGDDEEDRASVNGGTEPPEDSNEVPQRKVEEEEQGPILEEEPSSQSIDEKEAKEVPELEDSPPPSINVVTPSIRSGLRIKSDVSSVCSLEESQGLSQEAPEELEANQYTGTDETYMSHDLGVDSVNEMESEVIRNDVEEDKQMEVETDVLPAIQEALPQEELDVVEEMTVIDEVTGDGEQEDKAVAAGVNEVAQQLGDGEGGFQTEPDTEMVSEDELPTESSKEPLETEAVSDEELPDPTAAVDLPETEAVSEDELPPEKMDKKKKKAAAKQLNVSGKKKVRSSESKKRKLLVGDTYDPSSPTSENSCDESPAAKRAAVSNASGGTQAKPVTKARKSLPELEKYWKAVKEDSSDFTGWTYLLQYVDQENDIEAAREAYDAFLSHYPYCYGYWRKYADYEKRKGNKEKCEEVRLKLFVTETFLNAHYGGDYHNHHCFRLCKLQMFIVSLTV